MPDSSADSSEESDGTREDRHTNELEMCRDLFLDFASVQHDDDELVLFVFDGSDWASCSSSLLTGDPNGEERLDEKDKNCDVISQHDGVNVSSKDTFLGVNVAVVVAVASAAILGASADAALDNDDSLIAIEDVTVRRNC